MKKVLRNAKNGTQTTAQIASNQPTKRPHLCNGGRELQIMNPAPDFGLESNSNPNEYTPAAWHDLLKPSPDNNTGIKGG
jgi:hypothetical protein